ncbi:MAG: PstS family phosphate ABC transporter substrate-binding protein [Ilyomonas sp.]
MNEKIKSFVAFAIVIFFISACGGKKEEVYDTPIKGTINISVDETFKPVISEEIKVYESSYPDAHIIAEYKPQADCLRDLQKDSTRMVIVATGLTSGEAKAYENKLSYRPKYDVLAYDAVSVVINIASPDSVFTIEMLRKLLTDSLQNKEAIVDGSNATSTVKYLQDSVLRGNPFGSNVRAAEGSKAVLDYVSTHINAIGFVGSSWIGNDEDPEQMAYRKKVRLGLVECKSCGSDIFAKPSQATIMYGQYPLVRPLYYILKENRTGLGSGFVNFMSYERGQLIFKRALLVPAKIDFRIRKVL